MFYNQLPLVKHKTSCFVTTVNKCEITVNTIVQISFFLPLLWTISHVLLLLVKVPLIVLLYYDMDVDVSVPLSQLVVLGKSDINDKSQ